MSATELPIEGATDDSAKWTPVLSDGHVETEAPLPREEETVDAACIQCPHW
jgi:hypothetical protein